MIGLLAVHLTALLVLPILLVGIVNRTKSIWGGRRGPQLHQLFFDLWRLEHPTPAEQAEVHEAIRQGLADIEAGRYRPADEVMIEHRPAESVVHLTSGSASYTLHTYNPEDFPRLPDVTSVQTFPVDRESLLGTIQRVPRASRQSSLT